MTAMYLQSGLENTEHGILRIRSGHWLDIPQYWLLQQDIFELYASEYLVEARDVIVQFKAKGLQDNTSVYGFIYQGFGCEIHELVYNNMFAAA